MKRKFEKHFQENDPRFWEAVREIELPILKLREDYFLALARSIVGQQLSVKAAASIWQRFLDLFAGRPTAAGVLKIRPERLRGIGLSGSKVTYIRNLAKFSVDHPKFFKELPKKTDQEIISELTKIKGIGKWTVEMFLIFALGREDIFSHGDLGLRNAIKRIYRLRKEPDVNRINKITENWKPYRSHASRYLWKYLENE